MMCLELPVFDGLDGVGGEEDGCGCVAEDGEEAVGGVGEGVGE